ncbi:MAG: toxin-antitoxin system HicB family antitoxin [Demequina sp.]
MDMARHSEQLRQQLEATAAASTPKAQETARQLATAVDPAARLMIVEALSEAAAEISREIAPASVDLRVRGTKVDFVVTAPEQTDEDHAAATAAQAQAASVGADTTRTTVRIPEPLKRRAEAAAAEEGVSLNSWLVRAVSLHLEPGPRSRRGRAAARFAGWADQQD